ncbi:hypothetical protein [Methylorubrum sp. SB2]|uniref:hypothetical protein n=1 Tax=Methylorubrum subtropicum TaxID=3138812 RepID=UPI00313E7F90
MRTRLTMRAAWALCLHSLARGIGRMRRLRREAMSRSSREARRGNVATAAALPALFIVGL